MLRKASAINGYAVAASDGLYFSTCMPHYFMGMRLIVTFPFGDQASAHQRFLGTIVRMEDRKDGNRGIAVRFLL
jgi:hypothetical protein